MAKTDRTVLISNDQEFGQVADPNKLEAQITHAFDKIDNNDNEFIAHQKQVDPTSADNVRDKHVSNNDLKGLQDQITTNLTDLTNHKKQVDPTSSDTTRDKHVANNDLKTLQDQITTNDTASVNRDNAHKTAVVLDHPDQSVTTSKIKDLAVTSGKIAVGAVGRNQLDPTLFEQTANASKFQEIDAQLAEKATKGELFVNVKDYGAKGDGTTNATTAIQNAIDYVYSEGGGVVFIPKGTFMVSNCLYVKSNVTITGQGVSSKIYAYDDGTTFSHGSTLFVDKDLAGDSAWENIIIRDLEVKGPIDGARPNFGSAVEASYVQNIKIINVVVIKSADAGIRVDGYKKGITNYNDWNPDTNPYWGQSKNIWIENCTISNSVYGIELEGGATNVFIRDNIIVNASLHGIRLTSAFDCTVHNNKVLDVLHSALYIERSKQIVASGNYLKSTRSTPTAINLSIGNDVIIKNNICYGILSDVVTGTTENYITNLIIEGNMMLYASISIQLRNSKKICVTNNYCLAPIDIRSLATGSVFNNLGGIEYNATYSHLVQNGGGLINQNNINPNTNTPDRPNAQGGFLGAASAPPTTGTFSVGHWVQNNTPTAGGYFGWMCITAGTPGTWKGFGVIQT